MPSEANSSLPVQNFTGQKLTSDGRIAIPKAGWAVRIVAIVGIVCLLVYYFINGIQISDPLILFAALMPIQELIIVTVGWFFYKNPAQNNPSSDLVSVIVPIFNQKSLIAKVIDSIAKSTYTNIEIIAINDGSTDGTKDILDMLVKQYPSLQVTHKTNEGKRIANAVGFYKSRGKFIVFVDSDSLIDRHAIEEFMKTFHTFSDVGAVVGHAKVWNSQKNFFTKIQDSWYDSSFNIVKTTESALSSVVCCSGCLSAYRRDAISDFISLWYHGDNKVGNMPQHFKSNPWKNDLLGKISKRILCWCAKFDDAEDIALTAQTLVDWKTMYVSTAKVYTDVPDNLRDFLKQQTRWKKGWMRTGFFMLTFFWTKNPLISIVFYIHTFSSFMLPFIIPIMYLYAPLFLHQYWVPALSMTVTAFLGFVQGMDYKYRDRSSTTWKYKCIANVVTGFLLPWLMIPALFTMRKNQWLTR